MPPALPELIFSHAPLAQWRAWLGREGSSAKGVMLLITRQKDTGPEAEDALTYDGALDEALCFGWIDSGGRKVDQQTKTQFVRFTPRREKSSFSYRNVGIIERLEAEGRMAPAGEAAVSSAKANGIFGVPNPGQPARPTPNAKPHTDGKPRGTKAKSPKSAKPSDSAHQAEIAKRPVDNSDAAEVERPIKKTRSGRPAPSYTV